MMRQQQLSQRLAAAAPNAMVAGNTRSKKFGRGEVRRAFAVLMATLHDAADACSQVLVIQQSRLFGMDDFLAEDKMEAAFAFPTVCFKSAQLTAAGIPPFHPKQMVHANDHVLDNTTPEEIVQAMGAELGSPSGHGPTSRDAVKDSDDEEEVEVDMSDDEDVLVSSLAKVQVDLRTPDGSQSMPLVVGFTPPIVVD